MVNDNNTHPYLVFDANNPNGFQGKTKCSTLEKAQKIRLFETLMYQERMPLIINRNTNEFIDWNKKDLQTLNKFKFEIEKKGMTDNINRKILALLN